MTQQTIEVQGLPEGWKAVAYRAPKKGEHYWWSSGITLATFDFETLYLIIVEKIQPRRIVLEETEEIRDPMLDAGVGIDKDTYAEVYGRYIWKEVKE